MDRLILNMHPKHKKRSTNTKSRMVDASLAAEELVLSEKEKKARMFPGLSKPDQEWRPSDEFDAPVEDATAKEVDDLMSQLEGVANKRARNRPTAGDFLEANGEPSPKRRRPNSPSPPRHPPRRSPSPPRDRDGRGGYSRGRSQTNGRVQLDSKPVLYKIYNARVSSLKEFGAFLQLDGVEGRAEGLCHISAIQAGGGRVNSPADLLSRGQSVKVKVMSIAGSRISLSMRDVDQRTGDDLTPHLRIKSDAELAEETRRHAERASSSNAIPLGGFAGEAASHSARRLTSPNDGRSNNSLHPGRLTLPNTRISTMTLTRQWRKLK
ncbi:uncharacterized protein EI90DRAFT_620033 [Cantharellus anzutake]|uniref:uncharacterized protein n=1 Tax=Cantharellus anzutake TaxID=1750568 RepID=UPI001907F797|nr:uncharacterized protein EI90DRAFT_620033 [Cantharellus anzutake]KAF8333050.1 hypothetical protein EI90DRAFT_620033 [Cantharellus anzutake]